MKTWIFFALVTVGVQARARDLQVLVDMDRNILNEPLSLDWGRDPFYKTPGIVKGKAPTDKLELKAILKSDDNISIAVINDQTVYLNSLIDGYAVREIGSNYVVLQKGSSLRELQLPPIAGKVNSDISVWDRVPAYDPSSGGNGDKSETK